MLNLIIDLGAHDGADLPYYLSQAKRVIAVEPIPTLAAAIRSSFRPEIESGKLVVIERVIQVSRGHAEYIAFMIDPLKPGLSHIATEEEQQTAGSSVARIKSILLEKIFLEYGCPDYLKIDLEGYDKHIIEWLCDSQTYWPYELSFERLNATVLDRFLENSPYKYFNILSFYNPRKRYWADDRSSSAGPFGPDIRSPWMERADFLKVYKRMPYPWFDIHAVQALPTGSLAGPPEMTWYSMPLALRMKAWLWRARERFVRRPSR